MCNTTSATVEACTNLAVLEKGEPSRKVHVLSEKVNT